MKLQDIPKIKPIQSPDAIDFYQWWCFCPFNPKIPRKLYDCIHPDFDLLKCRKTHYTYKGVVYSNVLRIFSIEATTPGRGHFTSFLREFRDKNPNTVIVVELVGNKRFAEYLEYLGFITIGSNIPDLIYIPKESK